MNGWEITETDDLYHGEQSLKPGMTVSFTARRNKGNTAIETYGLFTGLNGAPMTMVVGAVLSRTELSALRPILTKKWGSLPILESYPT